MNSNRYDMTDSHSTVITQSGLFQQGQIRLAELSVSNWGSFHGKTFTAYFDANGTLLTGDNGSGKSTLIDGLMALLLPAGKATFNVAAAQGDRSDRSLLSYMRGSYGSAHDGSSTRVKSKREKAVVTALRALYRCEDGSCITLAALFWTASSTTALSDVKRIYMVAKRNFLLSELLDVFGDGNARLLKQTLRNDPTITDCDSNFSDYQELYRKLLFMDNKNAPALLSRALGLKKIDDLTKLIRELVLEPSGVKDDAKKVVEEFSDLVAIHEELTDAKERRNHLSRLPELAASIDKAKQALESLQLEKNHLSIYFAECYAALWAEKLATITAELEALERTLNRTQIEQQDAQTALEKRHEEYLNLGGDKIESLKKDVEHLRQKLNDTIRSASSYQSACRDLQLKADLSEALFIENQQLAASKINSIEDDREQAINTMFVHSTQVNNANEKLKSIEDEIAEIASRPNSNIPFKLQQLRDELAENLNLATDQLVFIGELLDVNETEHLWQGAIERALGGRKTTLLVPQNSYSMVTRWLNVRHTGLHVRVQVVLDNHDKGFTPFSENGFLRKLVWKEHPYRDWLKKHLKKFDLQCVSGTDALDATPFSMTQQGLMHYDKGRFEKKDQQRIDDRRSWCLGFSNQARLALLTTDQEATKLSLSKFNAQLRSAREELDKITEKAKLWDSIGSFEWDNINAPYRQKSFDAAKNDLQKLQESGGDLELARNRWDEAKTKLNNIQNDKSNLLITKGSLEKDKSNASQQLTESQRLAASGIIDEVRTLLTQRIQHKGKITLENTHLQFEIEKELDRQLERTRASKTTAEQSANGIMSSFRGKDKWQPITADWASGLDALQDYLEHFTQIEKEGLPALIEQFKERLTKHATQSLARIKTKLESEREDIIERIETINQVLKRTEFKQGSHLKIGSKREKYPHVLDFEQKIRSALSQATSDDHERRFNLLAEVVEILEKASASVSSNSMESLRLLDPRYQISFYAEEIDSETEAIKDVLESSSGKSGGEKESFAGTIVAASLAYVLTPDGHDKPIYCTVFLDEAFSNTAEAVSRRVLRVFKELHIHINLITPYKNINLARESASSMLFVVRDAKHHESHLSQITWQEYDRRMANQKQATLLSEAQSLGVQIEKVDQPANDINQ